MSIQDAEINVGDYIFLDSPTLPYFLNRRWIEVEGKTIHGNPKAHLPRMGKATAGWTERTFKKSDILMYKKKYQIETELPRIVSLQEMYREKRSAWMKKMSSERQMSMQDLPKKEGLPHIDLVRRVILKRTRINYEYGLISMDEALVQELADLFKGGDSSGKG